MAARTVTCPCGFSITTESEDELVKMVQMHGQEVHSMSASREEVLAMAKPA